MRLQLLGIFSAGAAKHIDAPASKAVRHEFEKCIAKIMVTRCRREQHEVREPGIQAAECAGYMNLAL